MYSYTTCEHFYQYHQYLYRFDNKLKLIPSAGERKNENKCECTRSQSLPIPSSIPSESEPWVHHLQKIINKLLTRKKRERERGTFDLQLARKAPSLFRFLTFFSYLCILYMNFNWHRPLFHFQRLINFNYMSMLLLTALTNHIRIIPKLVKSGIKKWLEKQQKWIQNEKLTLCK